MGNLWRDLAAQYATEHERRKRENLEKFQVVAEFRQEIPAGWSVDGVGLNSIISCGDFTVALEGPQAIGRLLPGGLFTHALSPRLNGALRTPVLAGFDQAYLSFEHNGGDYSALRTIVDNAFLTERQQYLNSTNMSWQQLSTFPQYRGRRVYFEIATKTCNPNFPPRMGLGENLTNEAILDPSSWFGVSRVLSHDHDGKPQAELAGFSKLFAAEPPATLAEAAACYVGWFRSAVEAWSQDQADEQQVRLINWMLDKNIITNCKNLGSENSIHQLVDQYRQTERLLEVPQTTNGMVETGQGGNYPLNVRGDFDQEGEQIPRGYLEALTNSKQGFDVVGSGRRQLADLVADPANPLTARVIVNRVWYWLFGQGIVATPNNFGKLGQLPTHPELLDYLACRFVDEGWSIKQLVRSLVQTAAWRQSSQPSELAQQIDPGNLLYHHFALHRLEAEAVRDSMLVVSGQFEPRLYGLPIDPSRVNEDPQKRLVSGPLDGNRRRSLYTKITIMEPPQFLAVFNQPQPKIPTGRRDVSNTPLQSLTLLNDPFVQSQAGHWAVRLMAEDMPSIAARLNQMFLRAYSRSPTDAELDRWSDAVAEIGALHGVAAGQELTSLVIWKDIAHALFNTKEFIYVR